MDRLTLTLNNWQLEDAAAYTEEQLRKAIAVLSNEVLHRLNPTEEELNEARISLIDQMVDEPDFVCEGIAEDPLWLASEIESLREDDSEDTE